MSMLIATDQFNIFEEVRKPAEAEKKVSPVRESKVVRVVAVLPRRVESASNMSGPKDRLGSTDSDSINNARPVQGSPKNASASPRGGMPVNGYSPRVGGNQAAPGGILSSKILMESNSPLKELRLMNQKRKELGGSAARNSARFSMTNKPRLNLSQFAERNETKGILKSSSSHSSRSNRFGVSKSGQSFKVKRAVSFSENLEQIHIFDPNQSFKKGRG